MAYTCVFCTVVLLLTHHTLADDYFWHINDLHYDPSYPDNPESCFKDVPPEDRGEYGNIECDAPWKLIQSAVEAMAMEGRYPKFIVWSG